MRACEIWFGSADVRLSGTVWVAEREGVTPGVVLVGGSGPTDRSNGGYFHPLRDRLVAAGVTVLAFDKRGVGRSTGGWASAGVAELAGDVVSAVQALRAHPAVDRHAVGMFGHSEGGWVALRAAVRGAVAQHLILNSCPAASFVEAEIHALVSAGVDLEQARSLLERLGRAVRADADLATASRIIADEPDPALRELLRQIDFRLTDESYSLLRAWIDYDPAPDLRSLRTPALAIYGARDPLTPVEASRARLTGLTPPVRTDVFREADHRVCVGDALAPGYLDLVADWCTSGRPRSSL